MMRSLYVIDEVMSWDGYDDLPIVALSVEFRMPNIKRYTGIGCPRIHLHLSSVVIRGHRLDETQMIMLLPLSLSGAAQSCLLHWTPHNAGHGLIWNKSFSDSIPLIL